MPRFRTSIAGLLGLVAVIGIATAALIYPSPLAGNGCYSLALATLTIAVLAAVYSRASRRAFWVGFSTCGWLYWIACFGPEPLSHVSRYLITTTLIDIVYPYTVPSDRGIAAHRPAGTVIPPSTRAGARSPRAGAIAILVGGFGGKGGTPAPPPTPWQTLTRPDRSRQFGPGSPQTFRRIGHSLFTLVIATMGGLLTRHFRAIRDRESLEVS